MKTIWCFMLVLYVVPEEAKMIHGKAGQSVKLECGDSASFKEMEWKFGDQFILSFNGRSGSKRMGTGAIAKKSRIRGNVLEIFSLQNSDVGPYTCNVDGRLYNHQLHIVTVSASPSTTLSIGTEATLKCSVNGLEPGAMVEWQKPDGEQVQSETVQLSHVTQSDAGAWVCRITHNGESHTEALTIEVEELKPPSTLTSPQPDTKPSDTSKPTCTHGATCIPPNVGPALLGFSLWVWVGVGVCSLILVLIIVSIVLLHQRNRRMKRRLRKLRTIRQPLTTKNYCQCNRPAAATAPPQGRRRGTPSALHVQAR